MQFPLSTEHCEQNPSNEMIYCQNLSVISNAYNAHTPATHSIPIEEFMCVHVLANRQSLFFGGDNSVSVVFDHIPRMWASFCSVPRIPYLNRLMCCTVVAIKTKNSFAQKRAHIWLCTGCLWIFIRQTGNDEWLFISFNQIGLWCLIEKITWEWLRHILVCIQCYIFEWKNANNTRKYHRQLEWRIIFQMCVALDVWRVIFFHSLWSLCVTVAKRENGVAIQLMICVEHAFFPIDKFFGAHECCKLQY